MRWLAAACLILAFTGAAKAASWSVHAIVSPATMRYDAAATLTIATHPGARCSAVVTYANGRRPISARGWAGIWRPLASGKEHLTWHEETKSNGGRAVVVCLYGGETKNATAPFTVTH